MLQLRAEGAASCPQGATSRTEGVTSCACPLEWLLKGCWGQLHKKTRRAWALVLLQGKEVAVLTWNSWREGACMCSTGWGTLCRQGCRQGGGG